MKSNQLIILLLSSLLLVSFASPEFCRRTGIRGRVLLVQGNQMPSPDQPPPVPQGFQTTLYVYELTNISQVAREGSSAFYSSVATPLIKEIKTGKDGRFKVKLKPGAYSLFVKKGGLFYSSQFDQHNNIHPIEVKDGKMTEVEFQANYDAVY